MKEAGVVIPILNPHKPSPLSLLNRFLPSKSRKPIIKGNQIHVRMITMIAQNIIGLSFNYFQFKIVNIFFDGIHTSHPPVNELRPSSRDKMGESMHGLE